MCKNPTKILFNVRLKLFLTCEISSVYRTTRISRRHRLHLHLFAILFGERLRNDLEVAVRVAVLICRFMQSVGDRWCTPRSLSSLLSTYY